MLLDGIVPRQHSLIDSFLSFLPINMSLNHDALTTHDALASSSKGAIKSLAAAVLWIVPGGIEDRKRSGKVEKVEAFVKGEEDFDDLNVLVLSGSIGRGGTHCWQLFSMWEVICEVKEVMDELSG